MSLGNQAGGTKPRGRGRGAAGSKKNLYESFYSAGAETEFTGKV